MITVLDIQVVDGAIKDVEGNELSLVNATVDSGRIKLDGTSSNATISTTLSTPLENKNFKLTLSGYDNTEGSAIFFPFAQGNQAGTLQYFVWNAYVGGWEWKVGTSEFVIKDDWKLSMSYPCNVVLERTSLLYTLKVDDVVKTMGDNYAEGVDCSGIIGDTMALVLSALGGKTTYLTGIKLEQDGGVSGPALKSMKILTDSGWVKV